MTKVLVVCTGNICRSPMGAIALAAGAASRGLDITVDSAAITAYEEGNPIDVRARRTLERAGYTGPQHVARQVRHGELAQYALVLAMTADHRAALQRRARADGGTTDHIRLWREFDATAPRLDNADHPSALDVADPWFGEEAGFTETLEMVEAAIDGILDHLS